MHYSAACSGNMQKYPNAHIHPRSKPPFLKMRYIADNTGGLFSQIDSSRAVDMCISGQAVVSLQVLSPESTNQRLYSGMIRTQFDIAKTIAGIG